MTKSYGPNKAIDNLSLDIARGENFGLLGLNGAGKTTTVKMLVGLLKPDSGVVTIDGLDVQSNAEKVKGMIGYKPEAPYLHERLTAREILHFVAGIKDAVSPDKDIERLLDLFSLSERADDAVSAYSFGMKSKLAICAAFIGSPQLILLDEPTNGLDPLSVYNLKELLVEFVDNGGTILISSHILDFVEKVCKRFAVIDKGRIKSIATREHLLEDDLSLEDFFVKSLQ